MSKSKKKYLALNADANSFTDPTTLFNISGNQIKEVGNSVFNSFYVKRGIRNGHLKEVTKLEFDKFVEDNEKSIELNKAKSNDKEYIQHLKNQLTKSVEDKELAEKRLESLVKENDSLLKQIEEINNLPDEDGIDFDGMTIAEIKEYIHDNYELSDSDLDKMESLKKAELVTFVEKLESEE